MRLTRTQMYTVSKDGALFRWEYLPRNDVDEEEAEGTERWRIAEKHFFMQNNATVTCAAFHAESNLLVVGFSNGIFGIYELPEFSTIQTLRWVERFQPHHTLLIKVAFLKTTLTTSRLTKLESGWHLARRSSVNS